jgi:hypothetical protein
MEVSKYRKFARRLVRLLVLAGASYIVLLVADTLYVWRRQDNIAAQRLRILQSEPILHCNVAGIVPWRESEEINADTLGNTHGISFGGRTLTSLTRLFRLKGADRADVMKAFTACAESSDWVLGRQPSVGLNGVKLMSYRWAANLSISIESHTPISDQPIVQVTLSTVPDPAALH